ncbi:MAG TPA: holo-ACP synthase [Rhodocyclaceae bacterium]
MIFGVGTDLVAIARLTALHQRHGARAARRILAASEYAELTQRLATGFDDAGRFLAKRFAAKEAFAKAMGTGVRAPILLASIAVEHDSLGKPSLAFSGDAEVLMRERRLRTHLSLSDEADFVVAFVIVEQTT